jgi:hypothetical protein
VLNINLGWSIVPAFLSLTLVLGCASRQPSRISDQPGPLVLFSQGQVGTRLPQGWVGWIVHPSKKTTQYDMVLEAVDQTDGTSRRQVVLRAQADNSASGLKHHIDVDLAAQPLLRWQWKTENLMKEADTTSRFDDDSPVRIIVSFDGDKSQLPGKDRLFMEKARLLAGQEIPYATLMYIWDNRQPLGQIIPNAYTGRIKKIVAQTGPEGVGRWHTLERNIIEDYQRAFGRPPGKLLGIGVMTDTDNTRASTVSYYADISFQPIRPAP